MPLVTSENRDEFIAKEMAKKQTPKQHESVNLPEIGDKANVVSRHKERNWQGANAMRQSLENTLFTGERLKQFKPGEWKRNDPKFYGEEMESPPKDIQKWKHMVTSYHHPKHGEHHIVTSNDKRGHTITHYEKRKD